MGEKINLNFHQTFKPERQYICSILEIANGMQPMGIKEISSNTGIPNGASSGKVEPHIIYANYMGLIEYTKKDKLLQLKRTKLGDIIYEEDPGLQEKLTILLCHCMMLRDNGGAEVWSSVFKKILPKYKNTMKREMLLMELEQIYKDKINKKNFAPFIVSYEDLFSSLNILEVNNEEMKVKSVSYDKEFIFLYAYILFEYWDEILKEEDEIASTQLDDVGFGKAFGWDVREEYEVLQNLADKGLIRINRQLMPYTIVKLVNKETLVSRLYSELC